MNATVKKREYKFRVWIPETEFTMAQMVYFDFYSIVKGCVNIREKDGSIGVQCICCPDVEDHLRVEEFTGLYDKNGKEIYEGDIIIPDRAPYCSGFEDGDPVVVEMIDAAFWPFADNDDGAPYPNPHKSEVIGNAHEHKEPTA